MGVEFDFKYRSLRDFLVLINLDVPVEGLHLTKVHVENVMSDALTHMALGGRWRQVEGKASLTLSEEEGQRMHYTFSRQADQSVITSLDLHRQRARGKWLSHSVIVQGTDIFLTGLFRRFNMGTFTFRRVFLVVKPCQAKISLFRKGFPEYFWNYLICC